ncbi:DUF3983 domain-containing protein (plasmid) [Rossellomorea vietnamensis]|uniref:DUF3983 domain-containing protein n=1 Tax=Rossellomorea vietnamensis TaxID=218284 RepID=A0A6I6UPY2_9BACI|nr:DUF3983 domain-containing protein [Rossellomorea vietnamensis]QHE63988.1 DUF3983 domain-containing protein [Rossellomorea vietnamensis]
MKNKVKRKRRLGKSLSRRSKEIERDLIKECWRNIWVRQGILK